MNKIKCNDIVEVKGTGLQGVVESMYKPNHLPTEEFTKLEVVHTEKEYPMGVNFLQQGFYTTQKKYRKVYDLQDLEKVNIGLNDIAQL